MTAQKMRSYRQVTERTAKSTTDSIKDLALALLCGALLTGFVPMVAMAFVGAVM